MSCGFLVGKKLTWEDRQVLFKFSASVLGVEEGGPFRLFQRPSFCRMCGTLGPEAPKVCQISQATVRQETMDLGRFAKLATLLEMEGKRVS